MNDVFISYTSADQAWAEWIAWVLEQNGYTVILRAWDFHLDGDLILNLHTVAPPEKQQFLVVLSETYQQMQAPIPDWPDRSNSDAEAYYRQLANAGFKLLPVLVDKCEPVGVFAALPSVSLVGTAETEAESLLLEAWAACIAAEPITSPPQGKTAPVVQSQFSATLPMPKFGMTAEVQDQTRSHLLILPKDYEYLHQLKARRRTATVQGYQERLTDALAISMVLIPAGSFLMGSPEDEPERLDREGPQHRVEVPAFCMGKYPVTQAEWRWVAENLSQVNRELNADPSHFKGDRHPVEQVSWYDAVEFCDRLSLHTGRPYRLPSEAEWEYACRAGTTTPFHFGATITTDLANYRGTDWQEINLSGSYDRGPKGEYRETTTPVDQFGITNAFGLCDVHGNVYEWCQDHYHESYEGAPTDGSAWIDADAKENAERITRGGCWDHSPRYCCSAYRDYGYPLGIGIYIGIRIVCSTFRAISFLWSP